VFCRNCGKELVGNPEVCVNCGIKPLAGTSFCNGCGTPTTPLAEICVKCGIRLAQPVVASQTGMPIAAGILSIIAGVLGLILGLIVAAVLEAIGWFVGFVGLGIVIVPLIIFPVIAIVGGVFALRRRIWGLALAGSIFAFICVWFLGLPAIILIALSKKEFK